MAQKKEEEVKSELQKMTKSNVDAVFGLLREGEYDILKYLAQFVANICDVECEEMFASDGGYASQCRWLFWLSYRYMTNEPYHKMSDREWDSGRRFSVGGIHAGVSKMSQMVETEATWRNRWLLMKKIIKICNEVRADSVVQVSDPVDIKVVIYKPSNANINVKVVEQ